MVVVLVAVLVMAASTWIAIWLEPRLGMLPARTTPAPEPHAATPPRCRFQRGAARPAVERPIRCTQPVLVRGLPSSRIDAEVANDRERQARSFAPAAYVPMFGR
jgi:hypothetical protein